MDFLKEVIQLIGFDVVFLGTLTVLSVCLGKFLWDLSTTSANFDSRWMAVKAGLAGLVSDDGGTKVSKVLIVAFVASLAGMVVNVAGDELLDEPETLEWVHLPRWFDEKLGCDEDCLKGSAIDKAAHLHGISKAQQLVASHSQGRHATAILQHAYAEVQKTETGKVGTQLSFELLVVKTLRILWLDVLLLAAVMVVAFVFNVVVHPRDWFARRHAAKASDARKAAAKSGTVEKPTDTSDAPSTTSGSTEQKTSRASARWAFVFPLTLAAFCVLGFSQLLLWMWSEQSERYYLKLLHAYIAQGAENDLMVAHSADPVEVFHDFQRKDKFVANLEFRNKDDGETKMLEFSAITVIAGKVIVADNETGALAEFDGRPKSLATVNGAPESLERALFEASFANNAIELRRAWPAAFDNVERGVLDFDDVEGLAAHDGALYMIGSHGRANSGEYPAKRQVLLRLKLDAKGEAAGPPLVYRGLMSELTKKAESLGLKPRAADKPVIEGLNIEGLAFVPGEDDMLLGLRAPLLGDEAIVLRVAKADGLFTEHGKPDEEEVVISIYALLDLNGQGISALEYDPLKKSFLVASSPSEDVPRGTVVESSLWDWRPNAEANDRLAETWHFVGHRLEGVARLPTGELMLAFDEETAEKDKPAEQFGRLVVYDPDAVEE